VSFRKNYLPSQSQAWAREVQSRIQTFERDFISAEINNRTRDDQLQSSYNRLDQAFGVLASQQSSLEAQQQVLSQQQEDLETALQTANDAIEDAADAAQDAANAAAIANDAITRLSTYKSEYFPVNATASFDQNSGTILSRSISVPVSTAGGGSREISAIAFCSVDAGVNSPGSVDNTPHRLTVEGTINVGGVAGSSKTFVGVRKGFTDSELGFNDSQVAVYGGGAMVPSASRIYSSSSNVSITASVVIDASIINGGFYFGEVRIDGILVNVSSS